MTVYLVRHAVAVGRSDWDADDLVRPLTKKGHRQAQGIVDLIAGASAGVGRIVSSPALRCVETVAPLAAKVGLAVEHAAELAEGADLDGAVALLRRLAADVVGDAVACAHGDLIPEIVRRLGHEGMAWDGELRFAKGSTWVLTFGGDGGCAGRYVEPSP
jgi:8-oxo-dGTP diphosphatase